MFSFQGTFVTLCKVTFEKLIFSFSKLTLVEMRRVELLTPCLQGRCSPN